MATQAQSRARKKTTPPDLQAELRDTMSRVWSAGRGVLTEAGAKGKELFDDLVEARPELRALGKKGIASARQTVGEASDQARQLAGGAWRKIESMVDDKVAAALDRFGVPSRDEIRNLSRRVADLTAKVEKLNPTPKRARARR